MNFFESLSPKDRRAILGLLAFFFLVVILWGLNASFSYKNASMSRLNQVKALRTSLYSHGTRLSQIQSSQSKKDVMGLDQSLLSLASSSAKEKKLQFKRAQPDGNSRLNVTLEDTNFDTLIHWLSDIQNVYGIEVAQLSIEKSKREGFVNARVTLKR